MALRRCSLVPLLASFGVLLGACAGVYDAPLSEMHPERGFVTGAEALAPATVEDTTALAPAAPAAERPGVQLARKERRTATFR